MLVLSRKTSEAIHIGNGIVVTVLAMQGSQIRLGIQAPHEVRVLRSELLEARPSSNEEANDHSHIEES